MIIMGIDPGIAKTGFGIISSVFDSKSKNQNKIKCLDYGLIETDKLLSPAQRLKRLYLELSRLINKYNPNILAVESVYFFKNLKTAIPVSQAKGVILLAAAQKKIPVHEFTPLQAKMAITGYGRAKKHQIQEMVKLLLNLKKIPSPDDAADALLMAICYSRLCVYKKN